MKYLLGLSILYAPFFFAVPLAAGKTQGLPDGKRHPRTAGPEYGGLPAYAFKIRLV